MSISQISDRQDQVVGCHAMRYNLNACAVGIRGREGPRSVRYRRAVAAPRIVLRMCSDFLRRVAERDGVHILVCNDRLSFVFC